MEQRRVKVLKYENELKVVDYEGVFHQFGTDYEEFENGAGNFPVAIVEKEDGTIENVYTGLIQFIK